MVLLRRNEILLKLKRFTEDKRHMEVGTVKWQEDI